MKFLILLLLCGLLCGLVVLPHTTAKAADEVTFYLDDGRIIRGEFLKVDGLLVHIIAMDGEKAFLKSSIFKIERAGKIVSLDSLLGKSTENKQDASYRFLPTRADHASRDGLNVRLHTLSIGGGIGYGLSLASEAIKDFPKTTFDGSLLYGGSIILFLPGNIGSENKPAQIGFEIAASKYWMELKEEGTDFGRLDLLSTMFLLKVIKYPSGMLGAGFHFEMGGGAFISSFDKGPFIISIERETGVQWEIKNANSPFFELGSGVDIFFEESASFSINARLFLGNIDTKWTACGPGACVIVGDFDKFSASSLEISWALRFWF